MGGLNKLDLICFWPKGAEGGLTQSIYYSSAVAFVIPVLGAFGG